jgi:FtsH-binding integral membrane protein
MTVTDNLFGTTQLSSIRAETIKKTYMLLGLSVAGGLCGGYLGAQSDSLANLFTGWLGWILAMVLLNVIPRVAIAARHNPVLGVSALLADGFVSGLVLAPILRFASLYSPGTTKIAMLMTLIVFGVVTLFVMSSSRTFSAPRGLMLGIFVSIIAAMVLNAFLNIGLL